MCQVTPLNLLLSPVTLFTLVFVRPLSNLTCQTRKKWHKLDKSIFFDSFFPPNFFFFLSRDYGRKDKEQMQVEGWTSLSDVQLLVNNELKLLCLATSGWTEWLQASPRAVSPPASSGLHALPWHADQRIRPQWQCQVKSTPQKEKGMQETWGTCWFHTHQQPQKRAARQSPRGPHTCCNSHGSFLVSIKVFLILLQ